MGSYTIEIVVDVADAAVFSEMLLCCVREAGIIVRCMLLHALFCCTLLPPCYHQHPDACSDMCEIAPDELGCCSTHAAVLVCCCYKSTCMCSHHEGLTPRALCCSELAHAAASAWSLDTCITLHCVTYITQPRSGHPNQEPTKGYTGAGHNEEHLIIMSLKERFL